MSKGNYSDITLSLVKQTNTYKSIRQPSLIDDLKPQSLATSSPTERFPLLSEYSLHILAHCLEFQFSVLDVVQMVLTSLRPIGFD